ncbi:sigma-54 dependent transcriptional regulator [Chryseobacterium sp.]|uniref:sigma-54 interaction domain-containing protein n=1 Tax=Chryseobacterium sp. TaxID=1871047 RepID=UPI0025C2E7E8|nr:sigma-54 dependent transcriptional regulator [Chryseobacterium sp.]
MKKIILTLPDQSPLSIRAKVLVFEDQSSRKLLQKVKKIAPSNANVLIMGETGTGKELIAREIHKQSGRSNGPFIPVNCGAFSENLIESELFGHEKGAFTGAASTKQGWFEVADGGTLFLDEIGDLPLHLQVKLLRVLQEQQVVRLGSRKPINVNVRIVVATNVNLAEAVSTGKFREDLYYRLNVATVFLSPLRERRGDIMPLITHFLEVYSRRLGLKQVSISEQAADILINKYSWPGNIRELENIIHQALLVCYGNTILPEDLNIVLDKKQIKVDDRNEVQNREVHDGTEMLTEALTTLFGEGHENLYEHIEEVIMRTAYEHCYRNQLETSRLLGISRNILRARLIKSNDLKPKRRGEK